jgi:hypothetical protein
MLTKERRQARSELASATAEAKRRPDDPSLTARVEELRRQYRAVSAEEYIKQLVEAAPPLTPEQRDRLALLLRPSPGAAA